MRALTIPAETSQPLTLVTGIGLLETTLALTAFLQNTTEKISGVINFGIAGAYLQTGSDQQAALLDVCLAEHEVLGDLGICLHGGIEYFADRQLDIQDRFPLDPFLLGTAQQALGRADILCTTGRFVTVQCVSGTEKRGNMLGRHFQAICENMEGAAVARVCQQFALPCLEVRVVSNLVEDRNRDNWQLSQACKNAGQAAAVIINTLMDGHD